MDIKSLFRLLTKRGWIVVLVAAGACAGAVMASKLQTPMFRSTVKLLGGQRGMTSASPRPAGS